MIVITVTLDGKTVHESTHVGVDMTDPNCDDITQRINIALDGEDLLDAVRHRLIKDDRRYMDNY